MFTSSRAHLSKLYQLMKVTIHREREHSREREGKAWCAQIFVRCDLKMNEHEAHTILFLYCIYIYIGEHKKREDNIYT